MSQLTPIRQGFVERLHGLADRVAAMHDGNAPVLENGYLGRLLSRCLYIAYGDCIAVGMGKEADEILRDFQLSVGNSTGRER